MSFWEVQLAARKHAKVGRRPNSPERGQLLSNSRGANCALPRLLLGSLLDVSLEIISCQGLDGEIFPQNLLQMVPVDTGCVEGILFEGSVREGAEVAVKKVSEGQWLDSLRLVNSLAIGQKEGGDVGFRWDFKKAELPVRELLFESVEVVLGYGFVVRVEGPVDSLPAPHEDDTVAAFSFLKRCHSTAIQTPHCSPVFPHPKCKRRGLETIIGFKP